MLTYTLKCTTHFPALAATTIAEREEMDRDAIATIAGKWSSFLMIVWIAAIAAIAELFSLAVVAIIIGNHFPAIVAIASLSILACAQTKLNSG